MGYWIRYFAVLTALLVGVPAKGASVQEVIAQVSKSPTGRRLIQRAIQKWGLAAEAALTSKIKFSSVSKTDAILTRHWDPISGKEQRDREVTVLLKEDQSSWDLSLDLVHEMTHALAEPTWDPYDPGLTALKYIQLTLEGEGGEVEAMENECQFALEERPDSARCQRYMGENGQIMREKIREDFYRVGKYYSTIQKFLGAEYKKLPMLSNREPALYSSTGRAPYPVALLKEYEDLNQVACENSLRRLQMSSARSEKPVTPIEMVRQFLSKRCGF